MEPVLRGAGSQVRPFLRSAEVSARSCSLPLQRAITDFGADHGFGHVPKKLQEHYGITIGVSTVRKITAGHGVHMLEQQDRGAWPVSMPGCRQQIGEIDGSMVPIVTIGAVAGDKRKQRTLQWQVYISLISAAQFTKKLPLARGFHRLHVSKAKPSALRLFFVLTGGRMRVK